MIILSPYGKSTTSWDGKHLGYILAGSEYKNNTLWFQLLDGKAPRKITNFGDKEISETSGLAFAPDEKALSSCRAAGFTMRFY